MRRDNGCVRSHRRIRLAGLAMFENPEKLLARAVGGDATAFTRLLDGIKPALHARISADIGAVWRSVLDADDVIQVTSLEAFLHITSFKPTGMASFVAWINRIADNNLQDAIRGLRREKRPDPGKRIQPGGDDDSVTALLERIHADSQSPSRILRRKERESIIRGAIARLPKEYRTVVTLVDLEGRSVGEVAKTMSRSKGAVHMLRARALEQIRSLLPSASEILTRT